MRASEFIDSMRITSRYKTLRELLASFVWAVAFLGAGLSYSKAHYRIRHWNRLKTAARPHDGTPKLLGRMAGRISAAPELPGCLKIGVGILAQESWFLDWFRVYVQPLLPVGLSGYPKLH